MPRRPRGEEALRLLRLYTPRLRWCPICGAPVLGRETCPRCGSRTLEVKLVPPGDAKPAWEKEKKETWSAAVEQLGREAAERLLGGPTAFWLLNPVQALDAAHEILVDGHTVAQRHYDPLERQWRIRPDRVGAEILVEEETGPYAIVDEPLRPSAAVTPARISSDARTPGAYVAVKGKGPSYGVARVLERGQLRVLKAWRRNRPIKWRHRPRSLSIDEAVEINRTWLEEREREAAEWLRETLARHSGRPLAGLSGGKDSTAAAAIAARASVEEAYTVDTGVEHPESRETVEKAAEKLGLRLHVAEAGNAFWQGTRTYGPPARDYRWCTRLVKLAPLSRLFRRLRSGSRIIMVTGQRGAESPQRAAAPRLAQSGTIGRGRDLVASPIQRWSSLEVFLYLRLRRLPVNPLYMEGYERIGCYMCPASHLYEFHVFEKRRPQLWAQWLTVLKAYARKASLPEAWATYGFWRWRLSLPSEARQLARRLGLNPEKLASAAIAAQLHASTEYSPRATCLAATLPGPRAPSSLRDWLRAAGQPPRGIAFDEDTMSIRICTPSPPRPVLAAAAAAWTCLRCGLCAEACPEEAITAPGRIEAERCTSCRACIYACPSSVLADALAKLAREALRHAQQTGIPRSHGRSRRSLHSGRSSDKHKPRNNQGQRRHRGKDSAPHRPPRTRKEARRSRKGGQED